ncbi:MAG: HNH endonuclease [Oligoflexia bacterium]|nr:HNH endonuclease [Oligoflexia bacterium]
MTELFFPTDEKSIKRERERASQLKKTQWWREKLKKGICYHCGKKFEIKDLSMDHLAPLARGGKTGKNNVVVSCNKCNSEKSFKTLVELRLKKI